MPLLHESDLIYRYSWKAVGDDDPRVTGKPDSTELNREEGYEVLAFINHIADDAKWKLKESGLKVERLIKEHLPGEIRRRDDIRQWVIDNDHNYD